MRIDFCPHDVVRVCFPGPPESGGTADVVLEGWIDSVDTKTHCRIVVDLCGHQLPSIPSRFIIRRSTPNGLLEFDAIGTAALSDDRATLTVDLVGIHRTLQRRDCCRVGMNMEVRYRPACLPQENPEPWRQATLSDVSIGGAALQVQDMSLQVGHELMVELYLGGHVLTVPSVIRRMEPRGGKSRHCCLEFVDTDRRRQDLLAKMITQAQLKLINTRVRVD